MCENCVMEKKYGFVREGKVYAAAFLTFPEREIGLVKNTEEEALEYFLDRFSKLKEKVEQVFAKIEESANKGSFLMKLKHLKDTLVDQKAIGDFESLYRSIEHKELAINEEIDKNRTRNSEIKSIILEELNVLVKDGDPLQLNELKEIQQRWVRVGKAEENKEKELQDNFESLINAFFENRKLVYEQKNMLYKEREEQYRDLIKKAQDLSTKKAPSKEELDKLHQKWKDLGQLPHKLTEELWTAFQKATQEFYKNAGKADSKSKNKSFEKRKSELLSEFKQKIEEYKGDVAQLLKNTLKEWKSIKGRVKELDDEFYQLVDYYFEKDFFNKVVKSRVKNSDSEEDKRKLALKTLKDLIKRDKEDLNKIEDTIGSIHITSEDRSNPFNSRIQLQKRKLRAKEKLLSELNEKVGNFI